MGPGGMRIPLPSGPPQGVSPTPRRSATTNPNAERKPVYNADLEEPTADGRGPKGFKLDGDVLYGYLGAAGRELAGWGARLVSGSDLNRDNRRAGSLSCRVALPPGDERWYRFRIRGLAQPGFRVANQRLLLRAEFFGEAGKNPLDEISQNIYAAIETDRRDLTAGKATENDAAVWRTYAMEFRLPFAEIDTLRLSVGFEQGTGRGPLSEFWIDEVELEPIRAPPEAAAFIDGRSPSKDSKVDSATLVSLGGRWYYDPRGGSPEVPERFDHTNADRLYYRSSRWEQPFADNMSAWLRPGYLDLAGNRVLEDRHVPDNVVLTFTPTHLVVQSHNLPNHPTAVFPDWSRSLDGNPNSIQEKNFTWHLPLEPRENPAHVAMQPGNANRALPGGPIGVAVNGVVFFNPYDADVVEALWRLDRCCGHPSPGFEYHYHKYPVCVKTPWFDQGKDHSPLIGFALDGFPVYGPYETAGVMAKDSKDNPLNAFNGHEDAQRGWHYHVSPGKFPYILGGFWGVVDEGNLRRRPPRSARF